MCLCLSVWLCVCLSSVCLWWGRGCTCHKAYLDVRGQPVGPFSSSTWSTRSSGLEEAPLPTACLTSRFSSIFVHRLLFSGNKSLEHQEPTVTYLLFCTVTFQVTLSLSVGVTFRCCDTTPWPRKQDSVSYGLWFQGIKIHPGRAEAGPQVAGG